jgi:outer membrane protein OmpA-like peptidoglycan-associated protein
MKFLRQTILASALLSVLSCSVFAQAKYTPMSLGLRVGTTLAYTDVRSHQFYKTMKNSHSEYQAFAGIDFLYMFSHAVGIKVDANIGSLQGISPKWTSNRFTTEDFGYQRLGFTRPIYFHTPLKDGTVNLYVNWTNLSWFANVANNKHAAARKWGMYSYVGLGMAIYNPKVMALYSVDDNTIAKEVSYLHGYSFNPNESGFFKGVHDAIFPVGSGIKYKINDNFDLGLEASLRFVATDKLDGVNDLGAQGNKYSAVNYINPTPYSGYASDKYAYLGLTLNYKIGSSNKANKNIEWNDPEFAIIKAMDNEMGKLKALLNDADKDGVSDAFDKESNTPSNAKVDGAGQALDVDGDGVADYKDEELFTPKGASVNENGIAADADGDGVADVRDMEPQSKAGALVNFRGVSIGSRTDSTKVRNCIVAIPSVYFDVNSSVIKPAYNKQLADLARLMLTNPSIKITITGNTDNDGSDNYNNALGKRRADAIAKYLTSNFRIAADRIITVESNGASKPLSTRKEHNRRVDFTVNQ